MTNQGFVDEETAVWYTIQPESHQYLVFKLSIQFIPPLINADHELQGASQRPAMDP